MNEDPSIKRYLISNKDLQVPFPNNLFLKWLEKWHTDAKRRDLNSQYCYAKAIDSLLRYPLPLESPKEATILKNVGPGIAEKLEKQWKTYTINNPHNNGNILNNFIDVQNTTDYNRNLVIGKSNSTRIYIPKYKSMSYGILLVLLCDTKVESNMRTNMARAEILMHGQKYCTMHSSTFQSNINNLIKRNLVEIVADRIVRYGLTTNGIELGERLLLAHSQLCNDGQLTSYTTTETNDTLTRQQNDYTLSRGSFDIVLLIDQIELNNSPQILSLLANRIKYEVRKLNLGDFIWIAKSTNMEIVLDLLIERKTINDLSSSIIDGRFREQKCRISYSNIRKAIYLVEGNLVSCKGGSILSEQNLLQAISNTIIRNNFFVKRTKSYQETVNYLINLTKYLEHKYQDCDIEASIEVKSNKLLPFNVFMDQAQKSKLLTTQEIMMAMLMQIKGVSFDKALAISKLYPTIANLYEAFYNCNENDDEQLIKTGRQSNHKKLSKCSTMLSKIQTSNKNLGKTLSEYIYQIMYGGNQPNLTK